MSVTTQSALVIAAVGSGLVGGVFFAFSTFIVPALRRVSTADGVRVMQAINRTAVGPGLMIAMYFTAAVTVGVAVWALRNLRSPASPWVLVGSALYLLASVLVTGGANVPRNNAIDRLDPAAADTTGQWLSLLSGWTTWNHVRTIGCLVAAVAFTVAILRTED